MLRRISDLPDIQILFDIHLLNSLLDLLLQYLIRLLLWVPTLAERGVLGVQVFL